MNHLSFSVLMQKQLQAKRRVATVGIHDEEWKWANRGRYYSLRARKDRDPKNECDVVTAVELCERIMPASETSMTPVIYQLLCTGDISNLGKDDVTRWLYKGMLKAILK